MSDLRVGTVSAIIKLDSDQFKADIKNVKKELTSLKKEFEGISGGLKSISELSRSMNELQNESSKIRENVDKLNRSFNRTKKDIRGLKDSVATFGDMSSQINKVEKEFNKVSSSAKKANTDRLEVGNSGKRAFAPVTQALRHTRESLAGLNNEEKNFQRNLNKINEGLGKFNVTGVRQIVTEFTKLDKTINTCRVNAERALRVLNSPVSIGSGYNSYLKSLKGIFPDKKITSTGYGDALNNNSIVQQYKNYIAGVDEAQRLYFQKLQMGAVERSRAERAYFKGDGVKYYGYQGTTKSSAYNQYYEKLISSEQTSRSKYVTKLLEGHRRVQQAEKEYMAKATTPASFAGNSFANQVKQYLDKEAKQIESAQNIYQSKLNRLAEQSQRLHREVAEKMANAEAMLMGGWKVPTYTEKLKGKTGSFTNGGYAQYLTAMNEATKASKIMQETNFKNMQSDLLKSLDYSKLASSTSKVKTEMNGTANSIRNVASASSTATGKTKELQSAFGSLSNTSGRLKSMVTMVSSLFAWQFANDLLTSIGETIKAKTEMTSLFQAMDLGSGSVKRFNEALDATVDKYQKLNKFSMGETVASLGVEFDLSTEQMTKAMPVLAMIQSEYIRAGRTSEEATLAVKDIMQGEFLRLSRETGVGQSELKNAGWNGAVQTAEDMDTLLDALQKVGESRHWDTFASKATSLNDVLLITQNRFSEFVAELVDLVAPAIVGFFNGIVGVFDGIGNWFHGLSGFMKGFLALPTLIATLGVATVSLINFRTGMSLVEIASNGLGNSLLATVFKLDKLKVAQWGSITTLGAMITKYKEATVASAGFVQSIVGRIIGVNELHLAENGLGNAIALTSKSLSMESLQLLTANEATLKWHQGLAVLIGNVEASTAKDYSFAQSLRAVITTMAVAKVIAFTAVIVALAVAFGTVYSACQKAKDAVDRFNYVAENGEDIIKKAENVNNAYSSRVSELKTELDGLTEGTSEYARKQSELNSVQKDAERATNNLADAKQAYANAQAIQTQLDQRQTSILGQNAEALRETYESLGIEDAYVKSSKYLNDVERGGQVLVNAMEQYGERIRSGSAHWKEHAGEMEEAGVSAEAISQYVDDYNTELLATAENWKKFNEGDMWAGLYA
ncbi:MAG: hypothetical protein HUJ56_11490, partial [Erysipelotrichaceae bacterium]|nr:hypothetical protein [Erysipelotrichaceae bacterium]